MANSEQPSTPKPGNQTDNVSLRVIALAHSTSQNEDIHLVSSLDTTISQLKLQLEQNLNQHPRPDAQRLIYQGRPLVDGTATLRQVLRLEPASTNIPPVHVLHLVIRDHQSAVPPNTHGPPTIPIQIEPTNVTPAPQITSNSFPPAFNLAQQAFPQGHPAQTMFQNAMQQHMAIHNRAAFPNHHQTPFQLPNFNIPQPPRAPENPSQSTETGPELSNITVSPPSTSTVSSPDTIAGSQQNNMTMRIEETIGPNGEHVRRVFHSGPLLPGHVVPVERSASAPGVAARLTRPNTPARSGMPHAPLPSVFPRVPLPQMSPFPQPFGRPMAESIGIGGIGVTQNVVPSRDPLVFLISSPAGPEALLFAPNHGYFTSQQTSSTTHTTDQTQSQGNEGQGLQSLQPVPTPTQPDLQNAEVQNNQPGHVGAQPQPAGRGRGQVQPGRREGEDIAALVLQRGWLFLRLYMFIFVLSEPGTWRRYILLLLASLICLLPRNNPFTDLFQVARRHFDNLIGPPQPPPRIQGQPTRDQQPGRQDTNDNPGVNDPRVPVESRQQRNADAQMPTPEEHARRLLHEHQERNPSIFADTLYRIEQAVVLFLASLIPGVGERHVRAREEARRTVQEEDERRRREEEERRLQQPETKDQTSVEVDVSSSEQPPRGQSAAVGLSTGVDATPSQSEAAPDANGGLRMRTNEATE